MVCDDPGEVGIVGIAMGRVAVGDEHADHLPSRRLVAVRVVGDTPKRALDAGAEPTTEIFVTNSLNEGAVSLSPLGPFRERMSKPSSGVRRLSNIEMSGRGVSAGVCSYYLLG